MKAISLKPPWPYVIFYCGKDIENRSWYCDHRGPLLIHASKTWDRKGYDFLVSRMDVYVPSERHHDFGQIVGMVEMVDCVDQSDSRWFFGDWGWVLENPVEFQQKMFWRDQLGLFSVPDHIAMRLR